MAKTKPTTKQSLDSLMRKHGTSAAELARKVGATRCAVSMWRRGLRNPRAPYLLGIVSYYQGLGERSLTATTLVA